jgi:alpha-1,3-rhamnosyl/mannosyltransferase
MRVVVNQMPALMRKTGVGHYIAELLRCLRRQAGPDEIDAFPPEWAWCLPHFWDRFRSRLEADTSGAAAADRSAPSLLTSVRGTALRWLRQSGRQVLGRCFRAGYRSRDYDLYHETNFIPMPSDLPTVATILDLSVLLRPEWHPAHRVAHFQKHFRRGLDHCVHFLSISEFSRQEIIRTLNIPADRITCTYMGIRPGLGPLAPDAIAPQLARLGLPPRYLLYLGTIEPRKNLLLLLRAYCTLPQALRDNCPLVLVGGWGWNSRDVADYFHTEARQRGVRHFGYMSEDHLPAIYNGARALVYPSLYEGFGLPPLEMMACGGAVLASTAGALVETVGSRAHLISAEDIDGWRTALARVIVDDDWRASLCAGSVDVARPYTWDRCAADTLVVYRSLCGGATVKERPQRRAA